MVGFAPRVFADGPTQQEMIDKINSPHAQVDQLKNQESPNEAAQAKIIQDVIADADKHSQLLDVDGDVTAGWDSSKQQFFISADNGNFYFHPDVIFQFRCATDYCDQRDGDASRRWQDGFEVRCA
jgi:hypothetical protein